MAQSRSGAKQSWPGSKAQSQPRQLRAKSAHADSIKARGRSRQRIPKGQNQPLVARPKSNIPAVSSKITAKAANHGAPLLLTFDHTARRWWEVADALMEGKRAKDGKSRTPHLSYDTDTAFADLQASVPTVKNILNIQLGQASHSAAQDALDEKRRTRKDSDRKWIDKVLRQGTLSDKIAALTLLVQEAPLLRLRTLDTLISMACKPDRRCARMGIEAVKDLFEHNILPDRKLTPWAFQDPTSLPPDPAKREALLAIWFYEDQLVDRVISIVERLEKGTFDTIENFKRFATTMTAELLASKPEQEARLLSILVNKLGDTERKTAPHAAYLLRQILSRHPAMRQVVAAEIQHFLHRPNLQTRALYNGVTFLAQLYIKKGEGPLARMLIETYFSLFKKAQKVDDLSSRMLSALLSGVNRAYPYLDPRDRMVNAESPLSKHMEEIYRTVHTAPFRTATQALMLLLQVMGRKGEGETNGERRLYRALYEKLKATEVLGTAKPTLFLNLLYKALKADRNDARLLAFSKRLLSTALHGSAPFAAGSLYLLSEVSRSQPALLQATKRRPSAERQDRYDPRKREPEYAFVTQIQTQRPAGQWSKSVSGGVEEECLQTQEPSDPAPACLWEVTMLRHHFHPSVERFAEAFASSQDKHRIAYSGDPLMDFSTMAFLDRFCYKNPKKIKAGSSVRGAGAEGLIQRKQLLAEQASQPVNAPEFLALKAEECQPDRVFFYRYFKEKAQRDRKAGKTEKVTAQEDSKDLSDYDDDEEALEDEEDENSIEGSEAEADEDAEEAEVDAYADRLAASLMENGGGIDSDDEDPDDSQGDSIRAEEESLIEEGSDEPTRTADRASGSDEDADAFMDEDSSDEDNDAAGLLEGEERPAWIKEVEGRRTAEARIGRGQEAEVGAEEEDGVLDWDTMDSDLDGYERGSPAPPQGLTRKRRLGEQKEVSSEDVGEKEIANTQPAEKKFKKPRGLGDSAFADYSEYERMIEEDQAKMLEEDQAKMLEGSGEAEMMREKGAKIGKKRPRSIER